MALPPHAWEEVKTAFEAALEQEPSKRKSFLEAYCADPLIRAEVERLLAEHEHAGTFLSIPVIEGPMVQDNTTVSDLKTSERDQLASRFRVTNVLAQGTPIVGQVLGHYLVLEQIGAGGMGMVFRASDQQLERDVAIKILPPGLFTDELARRRFRREALTLAKLNHPNIGTVYEFGSQGRIDYLVMEYVGGVGLDGRLGHGPLPIRDVLRIGLQLADGLSSAHEHRVIHRDLKPANLRLTQDNRLKILDFGLAQFLRQDIDLSATASMSETTKIAGTLPYMAPEQLRGEATDQRSDIWAAGAVLYELATGRRPFPSERIPGLINTILNEDPSLPSTINPKISPGLESAILKCLDKDPERRYQSARELRVDLDRLTTPVSQAGTTRVSIPVPEVPESAVSFWARTKRSILVSGLVVLVLLGAVSYILFHRRATYGANPLLSARRRTVAVLNLRNSTSRPESAWLSTGLAEMLTTELAAGERLRTITGEEIAQMKMSMALPDSDVLAPQTLAAVGKALGADWVVLGSYVALPGGSLRLDLHLQDVAAGETLLSVKQTGDENDLFDLVSRAGAELRAKCNVGELNQQDEAAVRAASPSAPEAAKLYAEGLARLRVSDAVGARDLLQKAIDAEPTQALAHSALSAAWSLLGYDEKARLSAKSAYDLSGALSREDRLLIEARYREASKEWNNAAENYRTLFGFFPDNLEYGLLLARAQTRGGKGKDALASIESLRKLSPPLGDDPRIELAASEAWESLGDFKQGEAFSQLAAEKARAKNEKLLLARALYQQGSALESLTDTNGALSAVEESGRIYESVGDRYGLASTLEVTGLVLLDRSDYRGALAKFNDELAIAQAVGNRKAEASALNNMGLVFNQQGNSSEAEKMFEKVLPVFQEISDQNNYANVLINIAGIKQDDGDFRGAQKTYNQALGAFDEINDQNGRATSLTGIGTALDGLGDSAGAKAKFEQAIALDLANGQTNPSAEKLVDLGDALQHLGDLAGARKNYENALTLSRAAADKSMAAYALTGLGNLEVKGANFPEAHKDYDEALKLRQDLGEKDNAATTQVAMATLAIEEGHVDVAEQATREARAEFEKSDRKDDQIAATAGLATVLVADGKTAEAVREVEKVSATAAKSQNLSVQLAFALARAGAVAKTQKATAETVLRQALRKATRSSYVGSQLECSLALEELEVKRGKSGAAGTRLQQLQAEAEEKGFNLIAKKAGVLATKN
jgi:eukaryotic-like serine/threonine-protein kinase